VVLLCLIVAAIVRGKKLRGAVVVNHKSTPLANIRRIATVNHPRYTQLEEHATRTTCWLSSRSTST
jgi:hypothetical protein